MLLKRQALSGAYGGFQCCFCSTYTTSTSPTVLPIPRARPSKRRNTGTGTQERRYATVRDSSRKSYDFRDNMNWPCYDRPSQSTSQQSPTTPSPYDILELEKGAAYSKHKFYELVKIYHPDRHNSTPADQPIHTLTRVERLDRYRLVVQAHEILSDPAKRHAFDMTGAGWGSKTVTTTYARGYDYAANESPYANATWEDWERWYKQTGHPAYGHGPGPSEGVYFNHNAFASLVIVVAVISGVLQATHVSSSADGVEERARAFTAQTHKFMNDRKVENATYFDSEGSHGTPEPVVPLLGAAADERVRHFLARRDPNRYGLKEEEEEHYRLHFQGKNFAPPGMAKAEKPERRLRGEDDRA
ncbi:uncharacterized protein AB675_3818 [Cyphellophora attinorum]|uniref:J domain-containing protein n=1 Tax=Cyphellophora attinorum TaxID=1664694 RepID=A0A0N1H2X0_9EURO|nr:uncharacterized protein AB675_3818 [Phialophora attinorum]KPI34947.1 hypothetical protein AB675_3818 [Phialophora attinorum]